ncbi:hypothetical protein D9C73_004604 [Collichthys lucidus]|uniref:Uncharacterized protein n=1 Tax=Collichthys lucidus TaxID=240159 RepID=A0A4U5UBJ3_COLLU|nr:hypothetical protein D9C73_004604 [Collichthys lucidus]
MAEEKRVKRTLTEEAKKRKGESERARSRRTRVNVGLTFSGWNMKITPYEAAGDGPHLSPPDTRALSSLSVAFIISEVGVVEVSPAELKKPTRHFEENELLELSPAKRDRHRSEGDCEGMEEMICSSGSSLEFSLQHRPVLTSTREVTVYCQASAAQQCQSSAAAFQEQQAKYLCLISTVIKLQELECKGHRKMLKILNSRESPNLEQKLLFWDNGASDKRTRNVTTLSARRETAETNMTPVTRPAAPTVSLHIESEGNAQYDNAIRELKAELWSSGSSPSKLKSFFSAELITQEIVLIKE